VISCILARVSTACECGRVIPYTYTYTHTYGHMVHKYTLGKQYGKCSCALGHTHTSRIRRTIPSTQPHASPPYYFTNILLPWPLLTTSPIYFSLTHPTLSPPFPNPPNNFSTGKLADPLYVHLRWLIWMVLRLILYLPFLLLLLLLLSISMLCCLAVYRRLRLV